MIYLKNKKQIQNFQSININGISFFIVLGNSQLSIVYGVTQSLQTYWQIKNKDQI